MAAAPHVLRASLLACRQSIRPVTVSRAQPIAWQHGSCQRSFTTSTRMMREPTEDNEAEFSHDMSLKRLDEEVLKGLDADALAQLDELAKMNDVNDISEYFRNQLDNNNQTRRDDREIEDELRKIDFGDRPDRSSLWYDEEDPFTNTDEEPFDEDDMTAMAHGKLDQIKEMRHYARLAVWEMPLLSKLAKPFKPPTEKQVLRWRYTDYMGDNHPADRKVVVQFAPDDLKLTPVQILKLKKLAGSRYNPETEIIKMSSDSFQHAAQNKAYLSNLIDDLIKAAKDPKDTFEDVPLDARHHSKKPKPKFPVEWLMTEERKRALEGAWERAMIEDGKKAEAGLLVDGEQKIQRFLLEKVAEQQRLQLEQEREAEMANAVPIAAQRGRAKGTRATR